MKFVWRLVPGAFGEWRGHRPRAGVVIEPPVATRLRAGSDIGPPFCAALRATMLAGTQRWTSASSPAKSLLRKQLSLLVFFAGPGLMDLMSIQITTRAIATNTSNAK
jgi:hypothetical protein